MVCGQWACNVLEGQVLDACGLQLIQIQNCFTLQCTQAERRRRYAQGACAIGLDSDLWDRLRRLIHKMRRGTINQDGPSTIPGTMKAFGQLQNGGGGAIIP